jgi:hypothetical protein
MNLPIYYWHILCRTMVTHPFALAFGAKLLVAKLINCIFLSGSTLNFAELIYSEVGFCFYTTSVEGGSTADFPGDGLQAARPRH